MSAQSGTEAIHYASVTSASGPSSRPDPKQPDPPAPIRRLRSPSGLLEALSQPQTWVVTKPEPVHCCIKPSDIEQTFHPLHRFQLPLITRGLPSMPPPLTLAKPPPIWRPSRLDPSLKSSQRPLAGVRRNLTNAPSSIFSRRLGRRQHRLPPTRSLPMDRILSTVRPSPAAPKTSVRDSSMESSRALKTSARSTSPQLTLQTAKGQTGKPSRGNQKSQDDPFWYAMDTILGLFAPAEGAKQSEESTLLKMKEAATAPIDYIELRKQETYKAPQLPCVFLHGLFGFSTLKPVAQLPQLNIDYWRGVVEVLEENGVEVLVTNVRTSASIEERAKDAAAMIEERFPGREVNLIGHSMGGLDCRLIASPTTEKTFKVRSVTTIATPHRGSPFAGYMLYDVIGRKRLPALLNLVKNLGIPGGGRAFEDLTTDHMAEFNNFCKDDPDVKYYSWGAAFRPGLFNEFRVPWGIIWDAEGHNDGLVSVESCKWGTYRGTLRASHIAIIGWGNFIQTQLASLRGDETPFDVQKFYLSVCEDLANDGF